MANNVNWDNVPSQLVQVIGSKIGTLDDFIRFSAVSKTWESAMSEMREAEKALLLLAPESPFLLLAEEVEGTLLSYDIDDDEDEEGYEEVMDEEVEDRRDEEDMEVDMEESGDEDMGVSDDEDMEVDEDEDEEKNDSDDSHQYHSQRKISVGSARGIYSLCTRKQYTIDLPEAAGKLLLGINKGWVLTLGENFKTNLLHPLIRKEISLPTMHGFRVGNEYSSCEGAMYINFVRKAVMSSEVQPNENVLPNPTIMIVYGDYGFLGFVRPGDKVWTKVDVPWTCAFTDIAYRMGKFYSINYEGSTFVCHIDDDSTNGRQITGTLIAECPLIGPVDLDFHEKYLVESGCDLWLLVRLRRIKRFKPPHSGRIKYRTTNFLVWKLKEEFLEDGLVTLKYTWNRKRNLENKAFFIGRNASVSLPSSDCISANCIYFTDDGTDLYYPHGGGHDMGVYNVENGTIVPHFQGRSMHHVSPSLWYL